MHAFQPGVDACVQASSGQTLEGSHELEKLHHAHASIESAFFRQVADAILGTDGVRAQHLHRALIGIDDRHDHPDGGALTRAVWTNEPGEGSIRYSKVDAANGLGLTKALPNGAEIDSRSGHGVQRGVVTWRLARLARLVRRALLVPEPRSSLQQFLVAVQMPWQ